MSARRNKIFDGVASSSSITTSSVFFEGDIILVEVMDIASDEFVEFAASLVIRVKQSPTLDICDDPIPTFALPGTDFALVPSGSREIFDMGDWEAPLDVRVFNSYALSLIPEEYSRSALEMKVCLIPSFDIRCKVWIIHQQKNTRNLYRYACAQDIKRDLQFAATSATLILQNEALALNTAFVTAISASLGAAIALPIGTAIFAGLQLTAGAQAVVAGIPFVPLLPPAPSFPLLPP